LSRSRGHQRPVPEIRGISRTGHQSEQLSSFPRRRHADPQTRFPSCLRLKSWFGERFMSDPRRFMRELAKTLALACPIMAGQVGQMLMGFVDTLLGGPRGTRLLGAA